MHTDNSLMAGREEEVPYLLWGEEANRAAIHSIEELERWIDRLTREAAGDLPFTIELYRAETVMLMITVGREESYVAFYSHLYDPIMWVGCGFWDSDEHVEYLYRGHFSGIDKRYTVPIAAAREAMRQFYQTGRRPENIGWLDWTGKFRVSSTEQ